MFGFGKKKIQSCQLEKEYKFAFDLGNTNISILSIEYLLHNGKMKTCIAYFNKAVLDHGIMAFYLNITETQHNELVAQFNERLNSKSGKLS